MRHFLMTALTIATLLAAGAAGATTPGPICRQACAPRIERDCGVPGIPGFKKCKRRLVRTCKRTTPALACARASDPGGDGGGSDDSLGARVTSALANKRLETGTSEIFDSGSTTTTDDMTLCESGTVHLVVTRITSTSVGDVDSTEEFDGTWTVRVEGGVAVLELAVGEPEPRRFAVDVDASGTVLLDGNEASVDDAIGACGTSDPGGGDPGSALVERLTEKLANVVAVLQDDNTGSGARVTVIVFCSSGRYALEIDATIFPGVEVSTQGDWSVGLDGQTPVIELAGEDGQPTRTFRVTDAGQGNVTLNGLVAQAGDQSLVDQVCPTI